MTKKQTPLSDRELRQALAGLREDVAAPADFRAKLMQRLQAEGIVAADARVVAPKATLAQRLAAFFTPARVGFAASAALALVFVLRITSTAPVAEPGLRGREEGATERAGTSGQALVASKGRSVASKSEQVAAKKEKKSVEVAQGPKGESLPEAFLGDEHSVDASAAVGDQSAAVAEVIAKPTVVVVHPTATPMTQGLKGNSELRGNVVRASQGEAAVLVYRLEKAGHVHVEIFNRLGQSVAVLRDAEQGPGQYDLRWAGGSDQGGMAASGIYVLQLAAPGYQVQHKLLLVK